MAWAAGTSFISCPFLLLGRISWLMPNPQASSRSSTHPICEEVNTICQKHEHRRFQRAPGAQVCVDKAWEISQWCHLLWAGAVPAAVPVLCWESPLTAPSPALCHSLAPQNQLWQSPACQLCCSEHTAGMFPSGVVLKLCRKLWLVKTSRNTKYFCYCAQEAKFW